MAWQPQQEPLRQLVQCLSDSLSGSDANARKNAGEVSILNPCVGRLHRANLDTDAQIGANITRHRQVLSIRILEQSVSVRRQHGRCAILPGASCGSRHAQERRQDHLQIHVR